MDRARRKNTVAQMELASARDDRPAASGEKRAVSAAVAACGALAPSDDIMAASDGGAVSAAASAGENESVESARADRSLGMECGGAGSRIVYVRDLSEQEWPPLHGREHARAQRGARDIGGAWRARPTRSSIRGRALDGRR